MICHGDLHQFRFNQETNQMSIIEPSEAGNFTFDFVLVSPETQVVNLNSTKVLEIEITPLVTDPNITVALDKEFIETSGSEFTLEFSEEVQFVNSSGPEYSEIKSLVSFNSSYVGIISVTSTEIIGKVYMEGETIQIDVAASELVLSKSYETYNSNYEHFVARSLK
jgi:hypothetical protein